MSKKFTFPLLVAVIGFVFAPFVLAETPNAPQKLKLPDINADTDILYLGTKKDPKSGEAVEGYAFIHRRDGKAKAFGSARARSNTCYAFMASGARWKTTENYMFDPTNTRGLDPSVLEGLLVGGVTAWKSQVAFPIFGTLISGSIDGADMTAPDDKNEVLFGSISSPGTIAVTTVWGIFSGPTQNRKLVEWDMVFDEEEFDWSTEAVGVPGKMDFLNIATHEIGHAAGMDHPSNTCSSETMYAYADFGEIQKRDLNTGDINGIKALYK